MTNLNEYEKLCVNCGGVFSTRYIPKDGYPVTLNTIYCSKSCAGKSRAKTPGGCIKPDVGAEKLRTEALAFIKAESRYCTQEDIHQGTNHSSKTFSKHKIKCSELNKELGFNKPKSVFETRVGEFLEREFTTVDREKTFDGLVGTTGHPLRVDFYIPEKNMVVEADGSQHSSHSHPWGVHKNGTVIEYDKIKDNYFRERGIAIKRIPYKRNIKESEVLSRLD